MGEQNGPCSSEKTLLFDVEHGGAVPNYAFTFRKLLAFMGPGFVMSLAYLDPGNLEADLQQGAYTNMTQLWVLWWATCAGLLLQELSSRLCMVTGLNLAEQARINYPRHVSLLLYAMMELAIIGSDIQEVVGSAIAFQLLFGWPLWVGCLATGLDSFTFLAVYQCGTRYFEALISSLIALIAGCFFANFASTNFPAPTIALGMVLPTLRRSSMVTAVGTLGAVIMPHNLYLHSGLVKSRAATLDRDNDAAVREANAYSFAESSIALLISFFVNMAVVGTFAHFFYSRECADKVMACVPVSGRGRAEGQSCSNAALGPDVPATCEEIGLDGAGQALATTIGPFGVTIWAVGLLAAGQASTMSTTLAGQVVMDGFLDLRMPPWQRALITRIAALGPSILITVLTVDDSALRNTINEWLNILQSIQLPFAIVPVLSFTASSALMGDAFSNKGAMLFLSMALTVLVLAANCFLVWDFLDSHPTGGWGLSAAATALGLLYFLFVGKLASLGHQLAREMRRSKGGDSNAIPVGQLPKVEMTTRVLA